ncbi:hypothetical protein AVEN_233791-1 [Araneus ventricosus]|uniref:Uncharacterized protein n=1 Tax=Araneus ventricosus TaxID=182803 RepID=A0A4Y2E1T0_ARAVE|nr:hypothetical protein AVEN_233791-1 [Araneus ventricosus]
MVDTFTTSINCCYEASDEGASLLTSATLWERFMSSVSKVNCRRAFARDSPAVGVSFFPAGHKCGPVPSGNSPERQPTTYAGAPALPRAPGRFD